MHFPEELSIKSIRLGLRRKRVAGQKMPCAAYRQSPGDASEGWLAEHMLIVGLENPDGAVHFIACAFPSACGKTNLAMLIPPESMPGWKVWTLGDDIAWLHLDDAAASCAQSTRSPGYFGVVPGTNEEDQQERLRHDPRRDDLHERRNNGPITSRGGKTRRPARPPATGVATTTTRRMARQRTRTPALRCRPRETRATPSWRTPRKAFRSPPSSSAGAARNCAAGL